MTKPREGSFSLFPCSCLCFIHAQIVFKLHLRWMFCQSNSRRKTFFAKTRNKVFIRRFRKDKRRGRKQKVCAVIIKPKNADPGLR
jgi:hypothetical protein